MAKQIVINGISIQPGETKMVSLNIAKLPSRTPITIPVYVFRSLEDGPTLLLNAGLHGDEINGIEIVRRLIASKQAIPQRGTVVAIPVLNIFGFINFSRDLQDGKDVNRSFPGNANGSLASRIAWHFMKEVLPNIDYGIDFHTGGASRSNYPQIRARLEWEINLELANAFAPPFILNAAFRENSLRKEASKRNTPIIVYEAGESLRLDEFSVTEGIHGTLRIMKHLNMIDECHFQPHNPIVFNNYSWVRAKAAGIWHSKVNNGAYIKKGEIIGTITGPYGEFETNVKSTNQGYAIGVNNMPIVNQGDALVHMGINGYRCVE